MYEVEHKVLNTTIQVSILVFTAVLVYFAFVYYPRALNTYKSASLPQKAVVNPVVASSNQFPIQTAAYKIIYEAGADTYYVFVEGENLDSYLINKQASELALRNALSEPNICTLNIIFVSVKQMPSSEQGQRPSTC